MLSFPLHTQDLLRNIVLNSKFEYSDMPMSKFWNKHIFIDINYLIFPISASENDCINLENKLGVNWKYR